MLKSTQSYNVHHITQHDAEIWFFHVRMIDGSFPLADLPFLVGLHD